MRILVTGAAGLLGREIVEQAGVRGHDVQGLTHAEMDVAQEDQVARTVERHGPDAIVHCAAFTAVDRAESEPEVARLVNRDGTQHIARAAARAEAHLLFVSTDYVFDGRKGSPYLPLDEVGPLSVYARTKFEGEQAALENGRSAMVARTSWLYGGESGFVPAILRRAGRGENLRVVDDQRGRPTFAPHAASAMLDLLERRVHGVWHVAGGGECSWLELAREAVRFAGLDVEVVPTSSADFGSPAQRPAYSVLDLGATESTLGRTMTHWRDALSMFMQDWKRP